MSRLEPKHSLFKNVDQMLLPKELSKLLNKPITQAVCLPMDEHSGLAGSELTYINTDAGRLVLKRMSITSDWIMLASDDHQGRSVRLWEYGLLDQLSPYIEHKIIAAAYDGEGWAILMEDLTGKFLNWDDFLPIYVPIFLDVLAKIHVTFWNDSRLQDSRLGLHDATWFLKYHDYAKEYTGDSYGVIPHWVRDGWEAMEVLLETDIFQQMVAFREAPEPLGNAMNRHPYTLLHGDYRVENLAYAGKPIAIDWQQATYGLMTIDLAWITKHGYIQAVMSEEEAIQYYRERLETYLNQQFDDIEWQAMVTLGYAIDALRSTCIFANFYKMDDDQDSRAWNKSLVKRQGQMVMDALPWL